MPQVTLEHVYPATYAQTPQSMLDPDRPGWVGTTGTLGVLDVHYGSDASRTRQVCVFMSDRQDVIMFPGHVTQEGDLLVHTRRNDTDPSILRDPQPIDLLEEYVNAWRVTGPEICDPQERADILETIRHRWRVLRQAEMGKGSL